MATRRGVGQPPPPAPAAPESEKLDYICQRLQRLVEIGEQLIGAVSIPVGVGELNTLIQAIRLKGRSILPFVSFSWLCPAGVITDMPILPPEGYYCIARTTLITSDFYDPTIILNVIVDDENVTPFGVSLTGPTDITYGECYVKRRYVLFSTNNPTPTDAVLTLQAAPMHLEKSFYDEFYRPIIESMYKAYEGVAYGQVPLQNS